MYIHNKKAKAPTDIPVPSTKVITHTSLLSLGPLPLCAAAFPPALAPGPAVELCPGEKPNRLEVPFLPLAPAVAVGVLSPSNAEIMKPPSPVAEAGEPVSGMVEEPITRPEGPRETTVPEIVAAGPLGEIVVPAMTKPVGAAVKAWPPTVKTDEGEAKE